MSAKAFVEALRIRHRVDAQNFRQVLSSRPLNGLRSCDEPFHLGHLLVFRQRRWLKLRHRPVSCCIELLTVGRGGGDYRCPTCRCRSRGSLRTSRRFTSIVSSLESPQRTMRDSTIQLRESEHRDPVNHDAASGYKAAPPNRNQKTKMKADPMRVHEPDRHASSESEESRRGACQADRCASTVRIIEATPTRTRRAHLPVHAVRASIAAAPTSAKGKALGDVIADEPGSRRRPEPSSARPLRRAATRVHS